VACNAARCRNRCIFKERTGLASARKTPSVLLRAYRRDSGAGQFVVMEEAAVPITV